MSHRQKNGSCRTRRMKKNSKHKTEDNTDYDTMNTGLLKNRKKGYLLARNIRNSGSQKVQACKKEAEAHDGLTQIVFFKFFKKG